MLAFPWLGLHPRMRAVAPEPTPLSLDEEWLLWKMSSDETGGERGKSEEGTSLLNHDGCSAVWTYDQQLVIWKWEGRERDAPLLGTRASELEEEVFEVGSREVGRVASFPRVYFGMKLKSSVTKTNGTAISMNPVEWVSCKGRKVARQTFILKWDLPLYKLIIHISRQFLNSCFVSLIKFCLAADRASWWELRYNTCQPTHNRTVARELTARVQLKCCSKTEWDSPSKSATFTRCNVPRYTQAHVVRRSSITQHWITLLNVKLQSTGADFRSWN